MRPHEALADKSKGREKARGCAARIIFAGTRRAFLQRMKQCCCAAGRFGFAFYLSSPGVTQVVVTDGRMKWDLDPPALGASVFRAAEVVAAVGA